MLGGINNGLYITGFAGFVIVALLALFLRWAFSHGHSIIEKPKKIGAKNDYGLLRSVHSPKNHIEGEMLRQKLQAGGVKATLTQTLSGPELMVFSKDLTIAKAILQAQP
jgi:hypothetical protein